MFYLKYKITRTIIKLFVIPKRLSEVRTYLSNYIISIPADFLGQLYIRRAIVLKLKYGDQCPIPIEILSLIPLLGPLHVSLNTSKSCFLIFHPSFNELYKEVFGKKWNLAVKPKPWHINLCFISTCKLEYCKASYCCTIWSIKRY